MTTQTSKIVYDLSQLIIRGDLAPDAMVTETQLAQSFGVSRTPVRQALAILSNEGLLKKSSGRSYKVRRFAPKEMLDAIEVRGVLEGLAARHVAENKSGLRVFRELDLCLSQEEEILDALEASRLESQVVYRYFALNGRFHQIILNAATNDALASTMDVVNRIPFVSTGSLARYKSLQEPRDVRQELRFFVYSHMQHREIVDAMRTGQGTRAEALMREHAQLAVRNIPLDAAEHLAAGESGLVGSLEVAAAANAAR